MLDDVGSLAAFQSWGAVYFWIMRKLVMLCLLAAGSAAAAGPYWINVSAKATGRFTVQVNVKTNLPDSAVLSASLGLNGQQPTDIFVGTGFQRITVKGGQSSIVLDGSRGVFPRDSVLPAGLYDVEVNFYPNWEENRALAAKLKVKDSLTGTAQARLNGSGGSASSVQRKAEARKWVMLNVDSGDTWDETYFVKKFGNYTQLPLSSGNPRILKMLYFPSIDMTFMINIYKGEIEVWRSGKAYR